MFLNKKSLTKIWILVGAYLALAILCFYVAVVFAILKIGYSTMLFLGTGALIIAPLFYRFGRYAEGKAKLLTKGSELVFRKLQPAEFIRLYHEKQNDPTNVISKPDFDILQVLVAAYDALGEDDLALNTIDQMIAIAPQKKLAFAKLLKCSLLFSTGKTDDAEVLYREVIGSTLNLAAKSVADVVMKGDRALAMGDDTTAEAYFNQAMTAAFPKATPLALVYYHYHLAEICHRAGRAEEAQMHLKYCFEHGGETDLQRKAAAGEIFL